LAYGHGAAKSELLGRVDRNALRSQAGHDAVEDAMSAGGKQFQRGMWRFQVAGCSGDHFLRPAPHSYWRTSRPIPAETARRPRLPGPVARYTPETSWNRAATGHHRAAVDGQLHATSRNGLVTESSVASVPIDHSTIC
jgi:hypothetical protein